MKYLIGMVSVVALIVVAGCQSTQNYGNGDDARGAYGPAYYQGQAMGQGPEKWDNILVPNYPMDAPGNQFGPRRDFH